MRQQIQKQAVDLDEKMFGHKRRRPLAASTKGGRPLTAPHLWNPLWLCSYAAMWLCGYVAIGNVTVWLGGYVAKWLDPRGSKRFTLKEVHRFGYELATVPV